MAALAPETGAIILPLRSFLGSLNLLFNKSSIVSAYFTSTLKLFSFIANNPKDKSL